MLKEKGRREKKKKKTKVKFGSNRKFVAYFTVRKVWKNFQCRQSGCGFIYANNTSHVKETQQILYR